MNPLQVKMSKRDKAINQKNENKEIPVFSADGSIKKKPFKLPKKLIAILSVILVLLGIVYLPGIFMREKESNRFEIQPDTSGIKLVSEAAKSEPEADFDNDGLSNSLESRYGTSTRNPDTDNDGVCDYAELFIFQTDPNDPDDTLYNEVIKEQGNIDVSDPYKIYNIVMWPDDMESRVYGGVVRTQLGYRFCNFVGWAQFPEGKYAYKVVDGVHVLLDYREIENAWRIEDEQEIVLTDEPLEMVHMLRVKGIGEYYLADNLFGKALSMILPNNGLISCKKVARIDTWTDANNIVTSPIVSIDYDKSDLDRYKENNNLLTDLAMVYSSINEGSSVLVSLNSTEYGEVVAEIYGYTFDGELLVADPNTLEPVGTLNIIEKTERYLNEDGEIEFREYFDFKGLGYDSETNFDRINFFAAAVEGNLFETSDSDRTESITVNAIPNNDNINTNNSPASDTTTEQTSAQE